VYPFLFSNKTNLKISILHLNKKTMSEIKIFLEEFEAEAITTHKMLSLVPTDKFEWRPHPKSMTMYSLSSHIADIAKWVTYAIKKDVLDISTAEFATPKMSNTQEILAYFEDNFKNSVADLKAADESTFGNQWLLTYGDQVLLTLTKASCIRHAISQTIHHRAQLGVYLRLLDIPIPGSYGPSADEM
jgi:uncharacterized damage-inducible protein DinB